VWSMLMKDPLSLLILSLFLVGTALAHCGCSSAEQEESGEVTQSLTTWNVVSVRLYQNDSNFAPSGTGLDTQLRRLSHGAVGATVDYTMPAVHWPGIAAGCTNDLSHDGPYLLKQACVALEQDGWYPALGFRAVMLQLPINRDADFVGCNVGGGWSDKGGDSAYWCMGDANTAIIYNLKGDGVASIDDTDQAGGLRTWGITHEALHTLPSPMPSTDITGHDGIIGCPTPGSRLLAARDTVCPSIEWKGESVILGDNFSMNWSQKNTQFEPYEYQFRAGWAPASKITTVPLGTQGTAYVIFANDQETLNQSRYELKINRPDFNSQHRFIWVEHRSNMWIGGGQQLGACSSGSPQPPCMTTNVPGLYVWLATQDIGLTDWHYAMVQINGSNAGDTTYYGMRQLPLNTSVTIEPGLQLKAESSTSTFGTVRIIQNQ